MADHDRGVHIQHQPRQIHSRGPGRRHRRTVTSARCAHATSRTAVRAPATAASSGSPSRSSSRHTVESDATGPNRPGWSARTAMSDKHSAPSATATARSTSTPTRIMQRPAADPGALARPTTARPASSAPPDRPAAGTQHARRHPDRRETSNGGRPVAFTRRVPLHTVIMSPRQAQNPLQDRHSPRLHAAHPQQDHEEPELARRKVPSRPATGSRITGRSAMTTGTWGRSGARCPHCR
jgi:hypothetical protein